MENYRSTPMSMGVGPTLSLDLDLRTITTQGDFWKFLLLNKSKYISIFSFTILFLIRSETSW